MCPCCRQKFRPLAVSGRISPFFVFIQAFNSAVVVTDAVLSETVAELPYPEDAADRITEE
ncbi:hypothetical protein DVF53_23490 [Salmonella enterica subsp. enterica serovar Kottbus]|nr:hypothetical protein [Salmonella enterica subsp. enterica serovar Kottbus]